MLLALCRDTDTPPTRWKPVTYALWLYLAFRPLLMIWHPHPGTSRHAFLAHPSHCTCYSELIYLGFTTRCLEDFFPPLTASFGCRPVTVYFIYLVFGATFFLWSGGTRNESIYREKGPTNNLLKLKKRNKTKWPARSRVFLVVTLNVPIFGFLRWCLWSASLCLAVLYCHNLCYRRF